MDRINRPAKKSTMRPTKQQVRQWLNDRRVHREPLPDIEQIQLQLGWRRDESLRKFAESN